MLQAPRYLNPALNLPVMLLSSIVIEMLEPKFPKIK